MSAPLSRLQPRDTGTHTPGPWKVSLHNGSSVNGASIISTCGRVVSLPRQADRPYDQKVADARLIAAAPDLLAAARSALTWCEDGGPCDWALITTWRDALAAAIARVEDR